MQPPLLRAPSRLSAAMAGGLASSQPRRRPGARILEKEERETTRLLPPLLPPLSGAPLAEAASEPP
jgi:hypothetical protein